MRVRFERGSHGVLDRFPLREEGGLDQEVCLHGPSGLADHRGRPGVLWEAPHFVHRIPEDALVRGLEPERDLEAVHVACRVLELLPPDHVGQGLDDHLVAAIPELFQDRPSGLRGELMVIEEVPGGIDLHQRLTLVAGED